MKKPTIQVETQLPRQAKRTDIAPAIGYAIVVDGHFKTEFDDEKTAGRAASELLAKFPMLKIEVYDAAFKSRTLVR